MASNLNLLTSGFSHTIYVHVTKTNRFQIVMEYTPRPHHLRMRGMAIYTIYKTTAFDLIPPPPLHSQVGVGVDT